MNTAFTRNLDLFIVFLKVMFNQEVQTPFDTDDTSDSLSRYKYKVQEKISTTDDEALTLVNPMHVANAYKVLSHFMKDKTKEKIVENEDEIDIYGRLLALRLRQLTHVERLEVMYEIDGIFLDRYRHTHNTPKVAIEDIKNVSDSELYPSTLEYFVSESDSSANNILEEMYRRKKYKLPEDTYSSVVSFDSFASFNVPDSLDKMRQRQIMKVCNNVTCDATQTYVRSYLPPGLLFECD